MGVIPQTRAMLKEFDSIFCDQSRVGLKVKPENLDLLIQKRPAGPEPLAPFFNPISTACSLRQQPRTRHLQDTGPLSLLRVVKWRCP